MDARMELKFEPEKLEGSSLKKLIIEFLATRSVYKSFDFWYNLLKVAKTNERMHSEFY